MHVGVNLGELTDGQNQYVFSDLILHGTPWYTVRQDGTGRWVWENPVKLVVDAESGFPLAVTGSTNPGAETYIGLGGSLPAWLPGPHVLLWSGNATIELQGDANVTANASSAGFDRAGYTGRLLIPSLNPAIGLTVRLSGFDPDHPIRALHLVPLELEATFNVSDLFHPRFRALLRLSIRQPPGSGGAPGSTRGGGGGPVLRFSNWQHELAGITFAPYSAVSAWEGRAQPGRCFSSVRQAGVPLEHMAALARDTDAAAAWFSVPQGACAAAAVAAGAGYLRNFTRFLVDELIAGAAAAALAAQLSDQGGGGGLAFPSGFRALGPAPAATQAALVASGFAATARSAYSAAGAPAVPLPPLPSRNLSAVILQYSSELSFYTDAAIAGAQLAMVEVITAELRAVAGEIAAAADSALQAAVSNGSASLADAAFSAVGNATFAALRGRLRFVVGVNHPAFASANVAAFATALTARFSAAAGGTAGATPALLPRRPNAVMPAPYTHPLQDFEAIGLSGVLVGDDNDPFLPFPDPAYNFSVWQGSAGGGSGPGLSDDALMSRLRRAVLDYEVNLVRLSNEVALWAAGNLTGVSRGPLPAPHALYVSHGGLQLYAPMFGARTAFANAQRANASSVPPAVLAAGVAEQAWHDRLLRIARHPLMRELHLDAMQRAAAVGVSVYAGADLLMPAIPGTMGLGLRKTGNSAAVEGWQVGYGALLAYARGSHAQQQAATGEGALTTAAESVSVATTAYSDAGRAALLEGSVAALNAALAAGSSNASAAAVAAAVSALQRGNDTVGAVSAYVAGLLAASPRLAALSLYAAGWRNNPSVMPFNGTPFTIPTQLRAQALLSRAAAAAAGVELALPPTAALNSWQQPLCPPPPAPACVYGTCYNGSACVCWAGASGPGCSVLGSPPSGCPNATANGGGAAGAVSSSSTGPGGSTLGRADLGLNLAGLADWSTQQVYVDIARQSRAWIPQSGGLSKPAWAFGAVPPLDAAGYPLRLEGGIGVGTMMVRDLQGHYPAGVYTLLYEGDGTLEVMMDDVRETRRLGPGLIELDIWPRTGLNNGIFVLVTRSHPADPLRNLRLVAPGFMATHAAFPFHPWVLHQLANYSTVRFMDATATNSQADTTWLSRVQPSDRTFTLNGMPWEHVVLLANSAGKHLWVNIPHAADDAYVASLAALMRDTVRPDLRITIEYSNEVWAGAAPALFAQAQGTALGLDRWSPAASRGPTEARFCFLAMRTRRIAQLWSAVWNYNASAAAAAALDPSSNTFPGSPGVPPGPLVSLSALPRIHPRLRIVVASQAVNADVTRRILACNGTGFHVDAAAVAPYFSVPLTARGSGSDNDLLPLPAVVAATYSAIANSTAMLALHLAATAPYTPRNASGGALVLGSALPLLAYEAGQSFVAQGSYIQTALAEALNAAPEMAQLHGAYLAALRASGLSGPLCIFSSVGLPSVYGSWGVLPAPDTDVTAAAQDPYVQGWPAIKWWALAADAAGVSAIATVDSSGQQISLTLTPITASAGGVSGAACAWNASAAAAAALPALAGTADGCPVGPVLSTAQARAGLTTAPGVAMAPCAGHGTCTRWPAPTCSCYEGWTGPGCTQVKVIVISTCPYQCNFRGSCVLQRSAGYRDFYGCTCRPGYSGEECNIVSCANHCSWSGRCVDSNVCACYDGYAGADCLLNCGCGSHGTCALRLPPPSAAVAVAAAAATQLGRFAGAGAVIAAGFGGSVPGLMAAFSAGNGTGVAAAVAALPVTCACEEGYRFQRNGGVLVALLNTTGAGAGRSNGTGPAEANATVAFATGACAPVCSCPFAPAQQCLRPGVCACYPRCEKGDCIAGACQCWVGYGGPTCASPLRPQVAAQLRLSGGGSVLTSRYSPVGMNVAGIAYWSTDVPFLNLMRSAMPWASQYKEAWRPSGVYIWDRSVLSPQNLSGPGGYPLGLQPDQSLATLMARDIYRAFPDGRYVVRYDGEGDLGFGFDAAVVPGSQRKGRLEIDVAFSTVRDNGIYMRVEDTNPANPIRNIRVLFPGFEALEDDGMPFHPRFLGNLRNYSALRFMDWTDLTSPTVSWATRPQTSDLTWSGRGVPLETMLHLCNILGVGPWLVMHDAADDAYVAALAAAVRDGLRGDVPIFVERGNEVWSAATPVGRRNYAAAAAAGVYGPQWHAARSVAMFRLWAAAFGPAARASRLTHVLSTQTVSAWVTATALAYNGSWAEVDAIGVTAYVDCGGLGSAANSQRSALLSVDQVLDLCDAAVDSLAFSWQAQVRAIASTLAAFNRSGADTAPPQASASVTATATASPSVTATPSASPSHGALRSGNGTAPALQLSDLSLPVPPWLAGSTPLLTAPRSLPLIVYEGGPGLVEQAAIEGGPGAGITPGLADLFIAAHRAPRMEATYRRYLDSFVRAGLVRTNLTTAARADWYPYMHYSSVGQPTKYGSWGVLETAFQDYAAAAVGSPKGRALQRFIADVVAARTRTGCANPAAANYDPTAVFSAQCAYPPAPIPPSGGNVTFASAPVSLALPPGAVNATVAITVAEVALSSLPSTLTDMGVSGGIFALSGGSDGANGTANATTSGADGTGAVSNGTAPAGGSSSAASSRVVATVVYDFGPDGTTFTVPVSACITVDTAAAVTYGWGIGGQAEVADDSNATAAAAGNATAAAATLALYWSSDGVQWTVADGAPLMRRAGVCAAPCGTSRMLQACA
jgi:hypothetical protein